MPIYEYSCQKCGARLEVMQKITDKPLKRCKNCGGKLEKEWSTSSFQLKGSGWYVTDYAAKKTGAGDKEPAKSGATETKTDSATDGGTDAKPAAAAETKAEPAASTDTTDSKQKKTSRPAATSNRPKSD